MYNRIINIWHTNTRGPRASYTTHHNGTCCVMVALLARKTIWPEEVKRIKKHGFLVRGLPKKVYVIFQ